MKKTLLLFVLLLAAGTGLRAQIRQEILLEKGWKFSRSVAPAAEREAMLPGYDDSAWQRVTVPHDWAITGPFDRSIDLQNVAVTQNGERLATVKTGRTGGLPYIGVGWYRRDFDVPDFDAGNRRVSIRFDGAMSEARVWINGAEVGFWPYGYNAFHFDITDYLTPDGRGNQVTVRLENQPMSSRWYPGAGLYRNVHLVVTSDVRVPIWGTYVTTPYVSEAYASIKLKTTVENSGKSVLRVVTEITGPDGAIVARAENNRRINHGNPFEQNFTVDRPKLWTPETPHLYHAASKIYRGDTLIDQVTTRFGIRDIRLVADKGFYLNGTLRKFQGVCNHHDLGPLGAAINRAALRRQLTLLKEMGCDAIRTAHNMPAPELIELCDEMGFMVMVENFDEWERAKSENGYHRFFDEWAEKDMINMLHQFRNNPSVVMWSIGNEVPTQCSPEGYRVAGFLAAICRREDPTRPITAGMDQVSCVLDNGFAETLDVPGLNYRTHRYVETYERTPQSLVLGSETASTVSSRGVYHFPVEQRAGALHDDHQSSSYDLETCSWSNIPDVDMALMDDYDWTIGQFVWTGFDYLGEPSPYDTDAWPNRSSMFGIIDLAFIPKDRYYFYRSLWNKTDHTLHILPHWTWPEREGEVTPVFVYTDYPSAELFINGKSQGRREKNNNTLTERYRLMWMETVYEPGELRVVAYDAQGRPAMEQTVRTAGKPHRIELVPDRTSIAADGRDLSYVTVRVVDRQGNLCPRETSLIRFKVTGAGSYRAGANGDPTSLDLFHLPQMPAFGGQLTAIVQAGETPGTATLEASARGLQTATLTLNVE